MLLCFLSWQEGGSLSSSTHSGPFGLLCCPQIAAELMRVAPRVTLAILCRMRVMCTRLMSWRAASAQRRTSTDMRRVVLGEQAVPQVPSLSYTLMTRLSHPLHGTC